MSELAQQLLQVILRGSICFADLWEAVDATWTFDEMQAALTELLDAQKIVQIPDTFAFAPVKAAA